MTVETLDRPPRLTPLYAKAAVTALSGDGGLPERTLAVPDLRVDRERLAAYDRVCGFRLGEVLPPTYLHVVAFPLAVRLMAAREFPFPVPGLIHLANEIVQHRPVRAAEPIGLSVRTAGLRPHRKGARFDVVAEGEVAGEPVWVDRSTYLAPGASARGDEHGAPGDEHGARGDEHGARGDGDDGGGPETADEARAGDDLTGPPAAVWRVPADMGRRYGAVSGDRNPIHLNPLAARLAGFPRTIVHGMWTKARALAALEGRLPESFRVAVRFKLPVVLPTTVAFLTRAHGDGGWAFAVRDADSDRPHLVGALEPR